MRNVAHRSVVVSGGIRGLGRDAAARPGVPDRAFAAVAAGLQAAKVWNLTGHTLIALVVGAAVVTLFSQLAGLWDNLRRRRRETLVQDIRYYLFGMFINVLEGTKVPARNLGFAAYQVRRR